MFADRMRLMLNVKKELFDSLQFSIINPTAYSDKVVRFDIHNQTARKDLINMSKKSIFYQSFRPNRKR